jgi:hypothetical protein
MSDQNPGNPTTTPMSWGAPPPVHSPDAPAQTKYTIQWGANGESRIGTDERDEIADAFEVRGKALFPLHGGYGALSLGVDGFTVWLYTAGGAFIAGEVVDEATARPRGVPASGTVEISSLPPDVQAAVALLIKRSKK